jgi:FkbM family methyltransferase
MTLRAAAKRWILGTVLESPAKRLLYGVTRSKSNLYDVQTIEIMRRVLRDDSVAIDIGAFEGSMLRHMIRFAPHARHFAFEPLPARYAQLKRRFPGMNVFPYALSDAPGEQPYFEVVAYPAMSGLRHRASLGTLDVRQRSVPVETLDRTIPGDVAVSLVKVDVEGGELAVLRGGIETLRRCRPVIVFECGLGGLDAFGAHPADLHALLHRDIGLRLFLLEAWLAGSDELSQEEFVRQFEEGLNFYFVAAP